MAEHDRNPWRRFLALPSNSRTKTIVMAFLVAGVSAAFVSGATVVLRPIQTANRAAGEQARIETLVQGIPGMSALLTQSGGQLSTLVVDLGTGRAADGITAERLDATLADPGNWTALDPGADLAGLGQRPNYAQVFLLRGAGEEVSLILLPLSGQGYGGRIDAILALRGDTNTIAGMTVTGHSETPGLGARIEEGSWQASFPGTELRDASDEMRFRVARGAASGVHEVDGITGATRTGRGITQMVRFWLGPDGYGSLLGAIRRGEF